jgi:flavin reductase (DIM6/NTAB) family NADH-FMN oxidoreductase RutF
MSSKPLHEQMADSEKTIQRNPHPDFKLVESQRQPWDTSAASEFKYTQTANTAWKWGDGANQLQTAADAEKRHIEIDPYAEGRPAASNYKLLISAIIPRPVGFCSTTSKDGLTSNLAPFSYFNVINHDPPLFIFGFAGGLDRPKDSLKNLLETGECCVSIISEHFIEAANATSINAPNDKSEWTLTGLTPEKCTDVKASRVKEAVFSVEAKLVDHKEYESKVTKGKKTGVLCVIEGTRFWVREDALNDKQDFIDPAVSPFSDSNSVHWRDN